MKNKPNPNVAVIYARYSSQKQNDESIEQQVEVCSEFAKQNGYTILHVYADRATTGRNDKREQFQRMISDSALGQFGTVIAYKSNRMNREMRDALRYEFELYKNGVSIIFAREYFDNTASGRFMRRNMMNINQFYSENLSEDVKRGMSKNAEEQKAQSRALFGYKIENGQFVVDEERADIVRKIFKLYGEGKRVAEVFEEVKTARRRNGKSLCVHSIRNILVNPAYYGFYSWDGVVYKDFPAIITKEQFDRAEEVRKMNVNIPQRHKAKEVYVLSGKLMCCDCEENYVGFSGTSRNGTLHKYYKCKNKTCPHRYIRKDKLEELVFTEAKNFLLNGDTLKQLAHQTYQYITRNDTSHEEYDRMRKRIEQITEQIGRIVEAIKEGYATIDMKQEMTALDKERSELQEKLRYAQEPKKITEKDCLKSLQDYAKKMQKTDDLTKDKFLDAFIKEVDIDNENVYVFYDIYIEGTEGLKQPGNSCVRLSKQLVTQLGTNTNIANGLLFLVIKRN